MKTALLFLAVSIFASGNVFAKCKGKTCKEFDANLNQSSETRFGKHMRLHKGITDETNDLSHCVQVGNASALNHVRSEHKQRVKQYKKKNQLSAPIRVVMDESSNACEIGDL